MTLENIKHRFGIIGNSEKLNRAIETAMRVAPTDLSVLITGESGTGKEVMPKIIHHLSHRKHGPYIAVNCGAIPEGTIDSELFGHEKGAFTGASSDRKGYFEVANGGTIFLDEVGELPLETQVRLLRVLETGEFIRVGSSKIQKTNVRIVAATNVDLLDAIKRGRFREDLYYRLNTVPIYIPPLRERKEDIHLLFRKFSSDFAQKYRMPPIKLLPDAVEVLKKYYWPGNIRQLKNVTEQISIIEEKREIDAPTLIKYLPDYSDSQLPAIVNTHAKDTISTIDKELIFNVLKDLKQDVSDLKKIVFQLIKNTGVISSQEEIAEVVEHLYHDKSALISRPASNTPQEMPAKIIEIPAYPAENAHQQTEKLTPPEESLSLIENEKRLIKKALEKHHGKRKLAAKELGISERTLYRKIKEYNLE